MLNHTPENQTSSETRRAYGELRRFFTNYCRDNGMIFSDSSNPITDKSEVPGIARYLEMTIRREVAREINQDLSPQLSPTKAFVSEDQNTCFYLSHPGLLNGSQLLPILPVSFITPHAPTSTPISFSDKIHTFAPEAPIAFLAKASEVSEQIEIRTAYSRAALQAVFSQVQTITRELLNMRERDSRSFLTTVPPLPVLAEIFDVLYAKGGLEDLATSLEKNIAVLGLSRLEDINFDSMSKVGFLQVSLKDNSYSEKIHSISIAQDAYGGLSVGYRGSEEIHLAA